MSIFVRLQASDENILIKEGPEGFLHDANYPNAKVEGNCIGDTINSNVCALSSASQIVKGSVILGGSASKLDIGVQGGLSGRNVNEKMETETSYFPFVPSKKNSVSGQSKAESTRVSVSDAAEVYTSMAFYGNIIWCFIPTFGALA